MARTITGIVSSNKTEKTIVVTVSSRKTHPLYKKQYSASKKFMAHDEKNEAQIGDKVVIVETRPLSARKRYALQNIIEKAAIRFEQTPAVLLKEEAEAKAEKHVREEKSEEAEAPVAAPKARARKASKTADKEEE
ncbi:MAG: rpsQ [Candidatus Saccharibacteria bacterium]|nr:rpsQ [Candidatus Saccharibacteria bacterium]